MAVTIHYTLALCLLVVTFNQAVALANSTNDTDSNNLGGVIHDNKIKNLTKCDKAFCHRGKCTEVEGIGAVCSCPDERFYLQSDGKTCKKKSCNSQQASRKYSCGPGAICRETFDSTLRLMMPACGCPFLRNTKPPKIYITKNKTCIRDPRYKTCDWPVSAGCHHKCRTVMKSRGRGSYPQCSCNNGYKLDSSGKHCVVSDPCKADNSNGGCGHECSFNRNSLAVRCSCYPGYTLGTDKKSCMKKSCQNGNSGCEQLCMQTGSDGYYCSCQRGYHLNSDRRTCYDYDECAGNHGCDQVCLPDGNGYYTCGCNPGYSLQADKYSCKVEPKCINNGCSQFCNPTNGVCFCDKYHKLAADGKTCEDIDECALQTDDCQEKCVNTKGGYSCECFDKKATLSNDLKTCLLKTCKEIPDIKYGQVTCVRGDPSSQTIKVDDYCTFTCNRGTRLIGSSQIRCTETGYTSVEPHCEDVNECNDPARCGENELCSNTVGSYVCICKTGYMKIDGVCTDIRGPIIMTCPKDVVLELPDNSSSVTYTWQKPRARDPTDLYLDCFNCPTSETKSFNIGSEAITYRYSDKGGLSAVCSFKVKVIDITPPTIENCPNGTTFTRKPGRYYITEFAQVTASDNSGKVILTHDVPSQFVNPGLRTVNYNAKDESGNHATCSFYVNIVVKECPALAPPINGYHGCNDWHIGTFCVPRCNQSYAFYTQPVANKYHCGDDGAWTPPDPLPKCYPVVQPVLSNLKYISTYTGDCPKNNPSALKQVLSVAQNTFDSNTDLFCYTGNVCKLPEGPVVDCQTNTFTVSLTTDEDYSKVQERDILAIGFKKKIKAYQDKNKGQPLMALFIPPFTILQPLVDGNGLPVTPVFSMSCPSGSAQIGNQCVTCPPDVSC